MAESVAPKNTPHVERIGTRVYTARNDRGAELTIGYGPGQFTPGDLLKIAVLGCNALSSDARFARALGDDYHLTGTIDADYSQDEDRFTAFDVELSPDLAVLDPQQREQLFHRVAGAIRRYCTITHTLSQGTPTRLTVDGDPA